MSGQIFDASCATHTGNVRERNEDACLVRNDLGLWAVADGMGGHDAGDVASRTLVAALDAIERPDAALDLLKACEAQIFRANEEILALSRARGSGTIGTTAAVLLIRDAHYACLWAGDSRVYLISCGAIRQLSRDHTEAEELVATGTLSRDEAEHWPQNVITRAIGVVADCELEIVSGPVQAGDVFVLCSDGLTRHLDSDEIHHHASIQSAAAACEAMVAEALARGGLDNVTVVVVRLLAGERGASGSQQSLAAAAGSERHR